MRQQEEKMNAKTESFSGHFSIMSMCPSGSISLSYKLKQFLTNFVFTSVNKFNIFAFTPLNLNCYPPKTPQKTPLCFCMTAF